MAFNPETGTTTEGESIEEALANLREATTLYLEEFPAAVSKGHPLVTRFSIPAHAGPGGCERAPGPSLNWL